MLMAVMYMLDCGIKLNDIHKPRDGRDLKQETEVLMNQKILKNEEHGC